MRIGHADVVENTRVHEGPVEVHEHIEVKAPVAPVPARATEVERKQDARWKEEHAVRRSLRFGTAALGIALLTIVASLWFMDGVVRDETYVAGWADDEALAMLGLGLLIGFAIAWGTGEGVVLALVLGWVLSLGGMALAAYQGFTDFYGLSGTGQVLTVALALAGVVALAACTLGLAAWRGRRIEERIYGYRGEQRRGPAV